MNEYKFCFDIPGYLIDILVYHVEITFQERK